MSECVIVNRVSLKPMRTIAPNWARAGIIYWRLFKYTQQDTAGLMEAELGSAPPTTDRSWLLKPREQYLFCYYICRSTCL